MTDSRILRPWLCGPWAVVVGVLNGGGEERDADMRLLQGPHVVGPVPARGHGGGGVAWGNDERHTIVAE